MIVLCLGLPSSASTWAFNVVRGLLASGHPDMLGVYAEDAQSFHQAVPAGAKNVLLKTHSIDEALCRLIEASGSPMILTWRDPRDAAVSLSQRTGADLKQAMHLLQRSAACLLSIKECNHERTVLFDYADDYMNQVEAIEAIARCLGVSAPVPLVKKLHGSLKTDAMRNTISAWSARLGEEVTFNSGVDLKTHWHKNHFGDAKNGKWKDVAPSAAQLIDAMLGGFQSMFEKGGQGQVVLPWSELAVRCAVIRPINGSSALQSRAEQAETYLPRGWWRAEFDLSFEATCDRLLEVRIAAGHTVLAQRLLRSAKGRQTVNITFEHLQPVENIRLKCASLDDHDDLPVVVSEVRIRRLSSAVGAAENKAREISQQMLPGH